MRRGDLIGGAPVTTPRQTSGNDGLGRARASNPARLAEVGGCPQPASTGPLNRPFLRHYRFTPQLGADAESPVIERIGGFSRVGNPIEKAGGLVSFSSLRRELLDRGADRLGVSLADFEVFRFSEPYPPVESGLRVFWGLASSA